MSDPTPAPLTAEEEEAIREQWGYDTRCLTNYMVARLLATLDATRAERDDARKEVDEWRQSLLNTRRLYIAAEQERDTARRALAEAQETIAVLERQVAMETIDHDHTTADLMQAQERERVLRKALEQVRHINRKQPYLGEPDIEMIATAALDMTEQPAASGEEK